MKPFLPPLRLAICVLGAGLASCASAPEPAPPPGAEAPRAETADDRPDGVPKVEVTTLELRTEIAAPVEVVWETVLGPETYTLWTAPFTEGSYFEGSWEEGERIRFLAPGGSGMVAEIAVSRPHEVLSIRHLGYVQDGVEDTTSAEVRSWAPAYETYRFAEVAGGTVLTVEHEVPVDSEAFLRPIWLEALATLKSLCEAAVDGRP